VKKHIPANSGIGGGSDAAATLRLMAYRQTLARRTWLRPPRRRVDVPFFLHGRTALAEGAGAHHATGERPAIWIVLVVPPLTLPDKTRRICDTLERETSATDRHLGVREATS
jgi:4-diphosphocytidyl-2-C-methyl-D-erythritol kinase